MLIQNYEYLIAFFGLAFLGSAILPVYLKKSWLSLPSLYVAIGVVLPQLWPGIPSLNPIENSIIVEKITEITVIISLMGAGIKIIKRLKWRTWKPTFLMLFVTMPLFILISFVLGYAFLGFSVGAAILFGAVLAPTDPVLAGDVQVAPPNTKEDDCSVRFLLTSEAGLNDGLAFPFIYLAGIWVTEGYSPEMIMSWFSYEFLYKIVMGCVMGFLIGKGISLIIFRLTEKYNYQDSFVAIAITLLSYGITEILNGYGFLAVFVAAYFFRREETTHEYHKELHDFTEQVEKLLISMLLICFGVALGQGLLGSLTPTSIAIGLAIVLLVRPLTGMIGLINTRLKMHERWTVAFLGIKGIGSFYYLAYAINHFEFEFLDAEIIWSTVAFVVLFSIIIHSATAPMFMNKIDEYYKKVNA